jgi:hypothetical protein
MKTGLLACAALLAACATQAPRRASKAVTVDGWAAVNPARPDDTRRRAVADALRRAVETEAGVSLAARTRVRDGAAVSERVVTSAAGCVLSYSVLNVESRDDGLSARVRAVVGRDAQTCGGSAGAPPDPGFDGAAAVESTAEQDEGGVGAEAIAVALRGRLAAGGWRVVERAPAYRWIAASHFVDVRDARLGPLASARVWVKVKILSTADGRILGEAAAEASAVGVDSAGARRAAGERAAAASFAGASKQLEAASWNWNQTN